MKKSVSILIIMILLGSVFNLKVYAIEKKETSSELGVSALFQKFIDNSFENQSEFSILDSKGHNVTQKFIQQFNSYYQA